MERAPHWNNIVGVSSFAPQRQRQICVCSCVDALASKCYDTIRWYFILIMYNILMQFDESRTFFTNHGATWQDLSTFYTFSTFANILRFWHILQHFFKMMTYFANIGAKFGRLYTSFHNFYKIWARFTVVCATLQKIGGTKPEKLIKMIYETNSAETEIQTTSRWSPEKTWIIWNDKMKTLTKCGESAVASTGANASGLTTNDDIWSFHHIVSLDHLLVVSVSVSSQLLSKYIGLSRRFASKHLHPLVFSKLEYI